MNKTEQFNALLKRYRQGKTTEDENAAIESWLEQYPASDHFSELPEEERQRMLEELDTAVYATVEKKRKQVFFTPWVTRIAASLLILAVAGYGIYRYANDPVTETSPIVDIVAGTDKAILTLGNGSSVALNGTGTVIPAQGNAQIQSEAGSLSYVAQVNTTEIVYNTVATPRGGQYKLTLADGSKVWLNAVASLRFPTAFTGTERVVELTGEAYFEIAKNDKMPFKVKIPDGSVVEVLGTHFNIMAYAEEDVIKTTLLEGAVKVSSSTGEEVRLTPNEQVQITKQGDLSVIKGYDVSESVAWKNGEFIFNDTELEAIMNQVSRWYDVEVVYEDDLRAKKFLGSVSRKENVSSVLDLLELTDLVRFEIQNRKIIVKRVKK